MPLVSQLPAITAVAGSNITIADDGATTFKATYSQVLTYIQSALQITEAQVTNLTTDLAARLQIANLIAGTNITLSVVSGVVTISASGPGGFTWNNVTGTTQQMASNHGYITENGALTTLTLPTTSVFGDELEVIGRGAGGWSIVYGTNQYINFGSTATTTSSGSLSSTDPRDSVYLVCTLANVEWSVTTGPLGNLTVV